MADQKFTPGPWEWEGDVTDMSELYLMGANGDGVIIPHWLQGNSAGLCLTKANARLIAKAPELYEMLQETISELIDEWYDMGGEDNLSDPSSCGKCGILYYEGEDPQHTCFIGKLQALIASVDVVDQNAYTRCKGHSRHWFTKRRHPGWYLPKCTRCGAPNPKWKDPTP